MKTSAQSPSTTLLLNCDDVPESFSTKASIFPADSEFSSKPMFVWEMIERRFDFIVLISSDPEATIFKGPHPLVTRPTGRIEENDFVREQRKYWLGFIVVKEKE